MDTKLALVKAYFGVSSILTPKRAGEKGFKLFQKVRFKKIREREQAFYTQAKHYKIPFKKEDIDVYQFGKETGKLVLLVHGWESNAGCLTRFAFDLAEKDYCVIAFNLPGHAFYKSSTTNLLECKLAMETVLAELNPQKPFSVIAHSFGSAVVANALAESEYEVDRLVFLTNPNHVEDIFLEFKKIIGMGDKAYSEMVKRTTQMLNAPLSSLDVDKRLKEVNFGDLLLIHDKNDRMLPYSNAKELAEQQKNAQLVTLEQVGHYRMLWNDQVVDRVVSFIVSPSV